MTFLSKYPSASLYYICQYRLATTAYGLSTPDPYSASAPERVSR